MIETQRAVEKYPQVVGWAHKLRHMVWSEIKKISGSFLSKFENLHEEI